MRTVLFVGLVLAAGCRGRQGTTAVSPPMRKIDVHTHLSPGSLPHVLPLLEKQGIEMVVNLSGGSLGRGLEQQLQAARSVPGRVIVFCTPSFESELARGLGYGERLADELAAMHAAGCRGMKIYKSLGLQLRGPDGELVAVDDPGLDALFERAGALDMPVAIHTGDPRAFWQPVTPQNERYEELSVHPSWALAGKSVPSWDALVSGFERRVERHPKTRFIGLHFGNAAEDPVRVDAMLGHLPNLVVETGARIPELGRAPAAQLRDLFLRRQDRILFGTDLAAGDRPGELVLGSPGRTLPTDADVTRFFSATWRFFETGDRAFAHPTPIQGSWTIDGIGLPPDVLQKVYRENARRLLRL
jgi:predicted TIM-barrel fold metal-dependent hydrolase